MLDNILTALHLFKLVDFIDILVVSVIIYSFFLLIKESKAYPMAIGLGLIGLLFLVTRWAHLFVSNWLIRNFVTYFIIAVIILFQTEIRRFLTRVGARTFRKPLALRSFQEKIEDVCLAVDYMADRKIGALIAVENEISLNPFAERGTLIDAVLTKDLLVSLFFPHSPLHDGAVIIRGDKIMAAGCLLPLPATHEMRVSFPTRTRHLAAIGLTQETDAAVIIVSEESGGISLATGGSLERLIDRNTLEDRLLEYLKK
ncbi:MAG: diadenylate cyclase CdaA [Candidatus Aminicenantes bacterium]|nr:diadenylate cyclase CdaA [Candidatus Aminicenantes bacterium]